jgi:hypothetical protein
MTEVEIVGSPNVYAHLAKSAPSIQNRAILGASHMSESLGAGNVPPIMSIWVLPTTLQDNELWG